MRGTRRMTSGRMDDDMPDSIRQNEHTKKCRHTMPEKWTEIDGEIDGEGEERERKGESPEYRREQDIHRKQGTKNPPFYERTGDN